MEEAIGRSVYSQRHRSSNLTKIDTKVADLFNELINKMDNYDNYRVVYLLIKCYTMGIKTIQYRAYLHTNEDTCI